MSAFKDMVARDLDAVFLNVDEFAELHMVEGKEIPVVMDDDRLTTLKKGRSSDSWRPTCCSWVR